MYLGWSGDFYVSAAHPVSGIDQWHTLLDYNTFQCKASLNIIWTFLSHFIMQMNYRAILRS